MTTICVDYVKLSRFVFLQAISDTNKMSQPKGGEKSARKQKKIGKFNWQIGGRKAIIISC